jgi:hypothetical protein
MKSTLELYEARTLIRFARDSISPGAAPQVSQKIRALLKSIDGAIRHAERMNAKASESLQKLQHEKDGG